MGISRNRILIVDDDAEFSKMAADRFKDSGWDVLTANSIDEAISQLGKNVVDVLLSDVHMAEKDARELLHLLSEMPPTTVPEVFLMSGYSDMNADEAVWRGARELFSKPLDWPLVFETLSRAVSQRRR